VECGVRGHWAIRPARRRAWRLKESRLLGRAWEVALVKVVVVVPAAGYGGDEVDLSIIVEVDPSIRENCLERA
jgi:hypothetical protein